MITKYKIKPWSINFMKYKKKQDSRENKKKETRNKHGVFQIFTKNIEKRTKEE